MEGLELTPEKIISYNESQLEYFAHQFSHTYRSIFPGNGLEELNIEDYYIALIGEKTKDKNKNHEQTIDYIKTHKRLNKAFELIRDFKKEAICQNSN